MPHSILNGLARFRDTDRGAPARPAKSIHDMCSRIVQCYIDTDLRPRRVPSSETSGTRQVCQTIGHEHRREVARIGIGSSWRNWTWQKPPARSDELTAGESTGFRPDVGRCVGAKSGGADADWHPQNVAVMTAKQRTLGGRIRAKSCFGGESDERGANRTKNFIHVNFSRLQWRPGRPGVPIQCLRPGITQGHLARSR